MKRQDVVDLIASWAKPEIFQDVYAGNEKEWADNLLHVLETECGMLPPSRVSGTREDFFGFPVQVKSYVVNGTPDWD